MALIERGALYPKHRGPAEPPEVWTTIATGMTADAHGVRSAGATRLPASSRPIPARSGPVAFDAALRFLLPARTVPASGAGRRVRTLWEIAGLTRPSAVVGWWASWPARGDGRRSGGVVRRLRSGPAKLLSQRADERDTAPESLFTRLARDFPRTVTPGGRASTRTSRTSRARCGRSRGNRADRHVHVADVVARLLDDPAVAASFTYLPGLDILRTRLLGRRRGREHGRGVPAVAGCERSSPSWPAKRDAVILLVADPGRSRSGMRRVSSPSSAAAPSRSAWGRRSRMSTWRRSRFGSPDFPSVARCVGAPPTGASEGARATPQPRSRPGGDAVVPPEAQGSDYDPEMVERLKSLGYLR